MSGGHPDNNEVGLTAVVHHPEQHQGQPQLNTNPGSPNNPAAVSSFTTTFVFCFINEFYFLNFIFINVYFLNFF